MPFNIVSLLFLGGMECHGIAIYDFICWILQRANTIILFTYLNEKGSQEQEATVSLRDTGFDMILPR